MRNEEKKKKKNPTAEEEEGKGEENWYWLLTFCRSIIEIIHHHWMIMFNSFSFHPLSV